MGLVVVTPELPPAGQPWSLHHLRDRGGIGRTCQVHTGAGSEDMERGKTSRAAGGAAVCRVLWAMVV